VLRPLLRTVARYAAAFYLRRTDPLGCEITIFGQCLPKELPVEVRSVLEISKSGLRALLRIRRLAKHQEEIIQGAMFARLLLADFVVSDLTLANAEDLERIVLTARRVLQNL
jgi:hypothetical protein